VIAEVYATMGDYPRSNAALDPSIATLRTARSADPVDFAHALNLKAFISATQGELKPALTQEAIRTSNLDFITETRKVALDYDVVSPYTAFLAVDASEPTTEGKTITVPAVP